jgi:hypothetical protein
MLSAMVLIGSTMPGVRHAHAGGDDPDHQHHTMATGSQGWSHAEGHATGHHSHANCADVLTSAADESYSHLHFQWFGFQLVFPDSSVPTEPRGKSGGEPWIVLRPAEELIGASYVKSGIEKPMSEASDLSRTYSILIDRPILSARAPVAIIFLCERARHERSGVQLT